MGAKFSANERALREEIAAGDERILAQARLLHEDVISRLAVIQEGQPRRRKRRNEPRVEDVMRPATRKLAPSAKEHLRRRTIQRLVLAALALVEERSSH
jgi:hypothetical protein